MNQVSLVVPALENETVPSNAAMLVARTLEACPVICGKL